MIKKYAVIVVCILSFSGAWAQAGVVKFDELQKILSSKNDTTYVLNFWATWCVPCVKEFPAFQVFAKKHAQEKVKVIMVSLDFVKEFDKTLMPFIVKHPIDARVWLLDEPDYNSWINKIDSNWGGEIPVTMMINGSTHNRAFLNTDFTPEKLEQSFNNFINTKQ